MHLHLQVMKHTVRMLYLSLPVMDENKRKLQCDVSMLRPSLSKSVFGVTLSHNTFYP